MIYPWTLLLARCCCISMLLLSLAFTTNAYTTTTTHTASSTTTISTTRRLTAPKGQSPITSFPTTTATSAVPSDSNSLLPSGSAFRARRKRVPEGKRLTVEECLLGHPWLKEESVLVLRQHGRWCCEYNLHIALPDSQHFIQLNLTTFQTSADMRDFYDGKELQLEEKTASTITTTTTTTTATTKTTNNYYRSEFESNNNNNNITSAGKQHVHNGIDVKIPSEQQIEQFAKQQWNKSQSNPPSFTSTLEDFVLLNDTTNRESNSYSRRDNNSDADGNNAEKDYRLVGNTDDLHNSLSELETPGTSLTGVGEAHRGSDHLPRTRKKEDISSSRRLSSRGKFHPCSNKLTIQNSAAAVAEEGEKRRKKSPSSSSKSLTPLVLCLESGPSKVYNYQSDLTVTLLWDPRTVSLFALDYRMVPSDVVTCIHRCGERHLCLLEQQICDGHRDCADGSDEDWQTCAPPNRLRSSTDESSPVVVIGVSVGVCLVVLVLVVPAVLMIHFRCRASLRQQQESHSLSSEMYHSPTGSMQASGIHPYDPRASLLQDQGHQHHQEHHQQEQPQARVDAHREFHPSHRQHSLPTAALEEAAYTIQFSSLPEGSLLNTQSDSVAQPSPGRGRGQHYDKAALRQQAYPHHIAISRDGEEGYLESQRALALRANSQSLINQQVFRPPPNKTIFDRASPPPPYSLTPPGSKSLDSILPTKHGGGGSLHPGQSCESASNNKNKNQASPVHVLRCHSMSSHRPGSIQNSGSLSKTGAPPDYHQVAAAFPPNLPSVAGSATVTFPGCRGGGGGAVLPRQQESTSHYSDSRLSSGANNILFDCTTPDWSHHKPSPHHTLSSSSSPSSSSTSSSAVTSHTLSLMSRASPPISVSSPTPAPPSNTAAATHCQIPWPPSGAYHVPNPADNNNVAMFVCTNSSPSICPCPYNRVVSFSTTSCPDVASRCVAPSSSSDQMCVRGGPVQQSDDRSSWPSSSQLPHPACSSYPFPLPPPSLSKSPPYQSPLACQRYGNDSNRPDAAGSSPGAAQDVVVGGSNPSKEQFSSNDKPSPHHTANALYNTAPVPSDSCYYSDIFSAHHVHTNTNTTAAPTNQRNISSFPTTTTNTTNFNNAELHHHPHHLHHPHLHPFPYHLPPYQVPHHQHLTAYSTAQDCAANVSKLGTSVPPSLPPCHPTWALSPNSYPATHSPTATATTTDNNPRGDHPELIVENNGNVFRRAVVAPADTNSLDSNGNTASISAGERFSSSSLRADDTTTRVVTTSNPVDGCSDPVTNNKLCDSKISSDCVCSNSSNLSDNNLCGDIDITSSCKGVSSTQATGAGGIRGAPSVEKAKEH